MPDEKVMKKLFPNTFDNLTQEERENPTQFVFNCDCIGSSTRFMLELAIEKWIDQLKDFEKEHNIDRKDAIREYERLSEKIRCTSLCR